jgi:cytochrome c peroxidase
MGTPARSRARIAAALAALGVCSCRPAPPPCDLVPELDADGCAAIHALALPAELAPAPGNAKGDDSGAAELGFAIFYDARFSSNQGIRCATCHPPERRFQDGIPTAIGLGALSRNTPTILNAARLRWQFWDGRADSVWSQALFPLENPEEMNFTRLEIAHRVAQSYRGSYEGVFGPLPALDDTARFPPRGAPGDPAFDGMAEADRDAVNRVAADVGKALEAYERKLAAGRAPLDRFLGGDGAALTEAQRRGLVVFVRAGCIACHAGPMLGGETFQDLGLPTPEGRPPDRGRSDGLVVLLANPFSSAGPYWDGPRPEPPAPPAAADVGAFRAPSLRNVTLSAPYGHDGRFTTPREVVDFHLQGGGRGDPRALGTIDARLVPRALSAADEDDLVSFFDALTGDYPLPPWNNWPDR